LEIEVSEELLNAIVPKLILQPLVENSIIHGMEGQRDGRIQVRAEVEKTDGSMLSSGNSTDENSGADNVYTGLSGAETCEKAGESKNLRIDIEDNGRGISDEYIKALETDDEETLKGHLGLNNVNTIMRMYYGKEYGVKASRREEGGTLITVRVPLEFGDADK
jgi:two-component system sensor histidine kinase YesM